MNTENSETDRSFCFNYFNKLWRVGLLVTLFSFGFLFFANTAFAQITISGIVYTDEGINPIGSDRSVRIKVNGLGDYAGVTNGSGQYSVAGVEVSIGNVVTVFLDGATEKAVTVTRAADDSSNISGLNLYQNFVIVRHEDAGPITNANLDQYDSGGDTDIQFTVTTDDLTVSANTGLLVWTGKTFTPGGAVTTPNLKINGTYNAGTFTHTITGSGTGTSKPLRNSGTFNAFTSTVAYAGDGNVDIEHSSMGYYNVMLNPVVTGSRVYQITSGLSITGDFTLAPTAASGSYTLTFNMNGNMTIPSGKSLVLTSSANAAPIFNITNKQISTGNIAVGAGSTLNGNTGTIIVTGSGVAVVVAGTFTAGSSTFTYNNASNAQTIAGLTYYNLVSTKTSGTNTLGGATVVQNNLDITSGSFDLSTHNFTSSGTTTVSGTILDSSGVTGTNVFVGLVTINNGGTWNVVGVPRFHGGIINNGSFSGGNSNHYFETNNQTISGSNALIFGDVLSVSAGVILTNNGIITMTSSSSGRLQGSGTFVNGENATLNLNTSSVSVSTFTATAIGNTVNYTNSTTAQTVRAITYYNLSIDKSGQIATLGGSVTVGNDLTVTAGTLQTALDSVSTITVNGTLTVESGAFLVVRRSSTSGEGAGQTINANNLVIHGSLNADGQGFGAAAGPGAGQSGDDGAGASYGGVGGISRLGGSLPGNVYGSFINPTSLGSGGGSDIVGTGAAGGAGGGAIILNITNTLTVNGTLSANGIVGQQASEGAGSGSGGSINITAGTLAGTGIIQAKGGDAPGTTAYAPGGGGRISVANVTTWSFEGSSISAAGGAISISATQSGATRGHAGTINWPANFNLIIGGAGNVAAVHFGFDGTNNYSFNTITINSGGLLEVDGDPTVNTSNGGGATISAATITINSGGIFRADSLGLGVGSPGVGANGSNGGGGSYGGLGGPSGSAAAPGSIYGFATDPVYMGSGGGADSSASVGRGGVGGGVIKLNVSGTLTVSGTLSANGGAGSTASEGGGGGSGGSINITAGTLAGTGTISATGGAGNGSGGGGGGGRISVANVTTWSFTGGSITSAGGAISSAHLATPGNAGTIEWPENFDLTIGSATVVMGFDGSNSYTFNSITINSGGTLRVGGIPTANSGNGGGATINATNVTINSGGVLDADGLGFGYRSGPGAGGNGDSGAGGGHGGAGGNGVNSTGGTVNGSAVEPVYLGSSGGGDTSAGVARGGDGGGAIMLNVSGTLAVAGTLSANGTNGINASSGGGGAAGGTINVKAGTVSGAGVIRANGGNGAASGGGGGGGRISIRAYTTSNLVFTFSGTMTVSGGTGGNAGSSGTIFIDPIISSAANQEFTVGDGSTPISTITIINRPYVTTGSVINTTDDIRIKIPAGFNMEWNSGLGTATIGGGASGNVSPTVTYEDTDKTLVINVTTNFAANDSITISGLEFYTFSAESAADNLGLEVTNNGSTQAWDDKTITIVVGGGITISGIVYSDEGTTPIVGTQTIRIKVNGAGEYTDTLSSGAYSISNVTINAAGDVITVFLDGATEKAVTVTRAADTTSNITGLHLYQNFVIVRHEDAGPITNTNLDQYDSGGDADIQFTVTGGNITVSSGNTLLVAGDKTYAPGGNITTPSLEVVGTLNSGANTLELSDSLGVSGSLTGSGNVTVSGGSATGDGAINLSGGTFLIDGDGNFGGNGNWAFNNLTFGDGSGFATTTASGSGSVTVEGIMTIATNQTLEAGSKTWNLHGSPAGGGGPSSLLLYVNFEEGPPAQSPYVLGATEYSAGSDEVTLNFPFGGAINATGATVGNYGLYSTGFDSHVRLPVSNGDIFNRDAGRIGFWAKSDGSDHKFAFSAIDSSLSFEVRSSGTVRLYWNGVALVQSDADTSPIDLTPFFIEVKWDRANNYRGIRWSSSSSEGTWYANTDSWSQPTEAAFARFMGVPYADNLMISSDPDENLWELRNMASYAEYGGGGEPANSLVVASGGSLISQSSTISFAPTGVNLEIPLMNYHNLELDVSGNTFNIPTGTLNVENNLSLVRGTLDLNTNDPNVSIGGNLTIASGSILEASNSGTFSVSGNLINNGTFNHNGGTVTLTGSGASVVDSGSSMIFNNLTSTVAGKLLRFGAGRSFSVLGNLTITGSEGSPINIESSVPGRQWILALSAEQSSITHAVVKDSGCAPGSPVITLGTGMVNDGNNGTCWFRLSGAALEFFGGGGSSAGATSGGGSPAGGGGVTGGTPVDDGASGGGTPAEGGDSGGGGSASP